MKIAIYYGTETGNAEMLADDIASHLSDHETNVADLADVETDAFDFGTLYLIVCSTYGDGELPASAQPFAERMEADKPDFSGLHFAVFGMGDSEYEETFNFGGKHIENLVTSAGAVMLGTRVTHDASGSDMAEDLALPWADEVLKLAEAALSESV